VSIIDNTPAELILVSLLDVHLNISDEDSSTTFEFLLRDVQIDNQLPNRYNFHLFFDV
jgi:hypothetical protein